MAEGLQDYASDALELLDLREVVLPSGSTDKPMDGRKRHLRFDAEPSQSLVATLRFFGEWRVRRDTEAGALRSHVRHEQ